MASALSITPLTVVNKPARSNDAWVMTKKPNIMLATTNIGRLIVLFTSARSKSKGAE